MINSFAYRILCCVVALLLVTGQVSGTVCPLSSRTSSTLVAIGSIDSRQVESEHDAMLLKDEKYITSIVDIRGGGVGSAISDFNEYVGASKSRSWAVLVFSIITDTFSVTLMKTAQAESSMEKMVLSFFGLFISLSGFALALKAIDVSIAYAVWAAVGTAIVSIAGIVFFGERLDATKIACISMIIIGVVGLELSDRYGVDTIV
mmetsp:Transcript_22008/g.44656  ORF Transcript_22008/g.44656 Transcript_22008/m.44656 type:complete len:204 (+) Transcript_22008:310-921(+)